METAGDGRGDGLRRRNISENDRTKLVQIYRNAISAYEYKGVLLHEALTCRRWLDHLSTLPLRPQDVLVASYPKSGLTWTSHCVSLLTCPSQENLTTFSHKPLHYRVPHLEVGYSSFLAQKLFIKCLELFSNFGHGKSGIRILATHLPYNLLPEAAKEGKCKVICVCRNPADVAVSYWYHHQISRFFGHFTTCWPSFFSLFKDGQLCYGAWLDHVMGYFRMKAGDHILLVKYEDMQKDLLKELARMAEFIGTPKTEEQLKEIASHCTFAAMKSNDAVNRCQIPRFPLGTVFDLSRGQFMRRGTVGDWTNYFSPEQLQELHLVATNPAKQNGLVFKFYQDKEYALSSANDNKTAAIEDSKVQQIET